jgi:hypothetical protein
VFVLKSAQKIQKVGGGLDSIFQQLKPQTTFHHHQSPRIIYTHSSSQAIRLDPSWSLWSLSHFHRQCPFLFFPRHLSASLFFFIFFPATRQSPRPIIPCLRRAARCDTRRSKTPAQQTCRRTSMDGAVCGRPLHGSSC